MSGIMLGPPGSVSAVDRGCRCEPLTPEHRVSEVNPACEFHGNAHRFPVHPTYDRPQGVSYTSAASPHRFREALA